MILSRSRISAATFEAQYQRIRKIFSRENVTAGRYKRTNFYSQLISTNDPEYYRRYGCVNSYARRPWAYK